MTRLYKATELAEILNVHPQTIYRAGERGELESVKVGKSVRFKMPKERTKQCYKQEEK